MKEKKIVELVLDELIKRKIIKTNNNTFEATKDVLKKYRRLDASITRYEKEIKDLKKSKNKIDTPKFKISSIDASFSNTKMSLDTINTRILELYQEIEKIKCFLNGIKNIVLSLESPIKEIMVEYFIDGQKMNEIARKYYVDVSTGYKKINEGIRSIEIELFPNKYIDSLIKS